MLDIENRHDFKHTLHRLKFAFFVPPSEPLSAAAPSPVYINAAPSQVGPTQGHKPQALWHTHGSHFVLLTNSQLPTTQSQLSSSLTQTLGLYSVELLLQGPEAPEPAGHVPLLRVLLSALWAPSPKRPRRCRWGASQAAAAPQRPVFQLGRAPPPSFQVLIARPLASVSAARGMEASSCSYYLWDTSRFLLRPFRLLIPD